MSGPSRFQRFNGYRAQSPRNEGKRVKQPACRMIALIVFNLLAGVASPAQQSPHEGHSNAGPVPLEILQRPVTLRTGIGELHEKVSTHSPEAQSFYDQGLAYVHSYVWIEAARSFHQALDRKSTRLNSSHTVISYAVFCLKKKTKK